MGNQLTPAQAAKTIYGLKSLIQGANVHGIHPDTLSAWYTEKPVLFRGACESAAVELGIAPDYRALLTKCLRAAEWSADELEILKGLIEADEQ